MPLLKEQYSIYSYALHGSTLQLILRHLPKCSNPKKESHIYTLASRVQDPLHFNQISEPEKNELLSVSLN